MLLSTVREWPDREGWALEPKWDGYRMLAMVDGGRARCWSRHGTELTGGVGDVIADLRELLPEATLVDGELVALARAGDGQVGQDFNRLGQTVFGRHNDALTFVVFDALRVAGEQLAERPWHERRAALEEILTTGGPAVRLTETFSADEAVHDELLRLGFEDSVLKRRDGRYRPGQRSSLWRKVKTRAQSSATVAIVARNRSSGLVERVGCRAADDPQRLTWALVWDGVLRHELTRELDDSVGRTAVVTYTHRTIAGALREARLTGLH